MTPETIAALQALGAWVRAISQTSAFVPVIAALVAGWTLARGKDWAPATLGRVVLYGAIAYFVALALAALAREGA